MLLQLDLKHIHKVNFYPSDNSFTQALLVMLVTNIISAEYMCHDARHLMICIWGGVLREGRRCGTGTETEMDGYCSGGQVSLLLLLLIIFCLHICLLRSPLCVWWMNSSLLYAWFLLLGGKGVLRHTVKIKKSSKSFLIITYDLWHKFHLCRAEILFVSAFLSAV